MHTKITNTSPIKRLVDNPLIKRSLILISGAGFIQVVSVLTAPIVTRMYTPDDFGLFSFLVSISVLLGILFPMGLTSAIVIVKDEETPSVILISIISTIIFCVISTITILFLFDSIFLFIPLFTFLSVSYSVFFSFSLKKEAYHTLNQSKILLATSLIIFNIVLGYFIPQINGLLYSFIIGHILAIIFMIIKTGFSITPIQIKWQNQILIIKSYLDFPLFQMPTNLLNLSVRESPIILAKTLFSQITAGHYYLVFRIIQRPLNILSENIGQVLFQIVAKSPKKIFYYRNILKLLLISSLVGSGILSCLLFVYGELVFGFIFGQAWAVSGKYAAILSPYFITNFLMALTNSFFLVLRKQQIQLMFSIIGIINVTIAFSMGTYQNNFEVSLFWFSLLETLRKLANFIYLFAITRNNAIE